MTSPSSPTLLERTPGIVWFFAGMLIASLVVGLLLALAHANASRETPAREVATAPAEPIERVRCPDEPSPKSLIDAAACGDTATLTALLANGADPAQTDPRPEMAGRTPLHHATQRGDEAQIALLLDAGAIPDLPDAQGNTPLHLLALNTWAAHPDAIARRLLDAGARLDVHNINGRTPLEELEADHDRILADQALVQVLVRAAESGHITEEAAPATIAQVPPRPSPMPGPAPEQAPAHPNIATAMEEGAPTQDTTEPEPVAVAPAEPPIAVESTALEPTPITPTDPTQAIRDTVTDWAHAWASKNMPAYFAHYHDRFTPENGLPRTAWAQQRQARIGDKAGEISVELRDLDVTIDGDQASVRFTQDYRASHYHDTSRKQLQLSRVGAGWQIVRERSIP